MKKVAHILKKTYLNLPMPRERHSRVAVIGAGSWGTTLAKLLSEKGKEVFLWAHEDEVVCGINKGHKNPLYLAEVSLPLTICATADLKEALVGSGFVVSAVPSHALRSVWERASPYLGSDTILVSCTKGIEAESLKLMSQVLSDCLPAHPFERRTVLSGPSLALEVAAGLPTSVVVAGGNARVRKEVQDEFRTETFLAFTSEDMIGVEVGGAVKNVIAIAAGISDGLKLGHNARAAIITRGLYEMIKIGKVLGANPLTFAGLSGIGDLVLTCTADISRNHTFGKNLGQGRFPQEILANMKMVVEGVPTAGAIHRLAKIHAIRAPICDAVYGIISEGMSPRRAVADLCAMELKEELGAILR